MDRKYIFNGPDAGDRKKDRNYGHHALRPM